MGIFFYCIIKQSLKPFVYYFCKSTNPAEGVRLPCDQCEYVGTRLQTLRKHKESRHGWSRNSVQQQDTSVPSAPDFDQYDEEKDCNDESQVSPIYKRILYN